MGDNSSLEQPPNLTTTPDKDPADLPKRLWEGHEGARCTMENNTGSINEEIIASTICGRYAIAVSNGSFKAEIGMLAFITEGKNAEGHLIPVNVAP